MVEVAASIAAAASHRVAALVEDPGSGRGSERLSGDRHPVASVKHRLLGPLRFERTRHREGGGDGDVGEAFAEWGSHGTSVVVGATREYAGPRRSPHRPGGRARRTGDAGRSTGRPSTPSAHSAAEP